MTKASCVKKINIQKGSQIIELIEKLYPICRSITGKGVRESLQILREHIPISVHEVPTGTAVYDWTVPNEWNIRDAWIKGPDGKKIIDFKDNNLHVLNYSTPVHKEVSLEELKEHLYTLPDQPDLIPYRTSYYNEKWGFCMRHNTLKNLVEGSYTVFIDSSLQAGSLTYGELLVEGETEKEVLISSHICHPSLCNDNLSGVATAVFLAKELMKQKTRFSYRFLFAPGTIGSITWLSQNEENTHRIKHGLVLSCIGDSGSFTYKKSRAGDREIDQIVEQVLRERSSDYECRDFIPYGYDERQYCSPGFNLSVGCLMRTPFGEFPEYHTSADNLDFVEPEKLAGSLSLLRDIMDRIEKNRCYLNQNPKGEPNLGKRGLYDLAGGKMGNEQYKMAIFWVLNLSDGSHSLLDITDRSGIPFSVIYEAKDDLVRTGLLEVVG